MCRRLFPFGSVLFFLGMLLLFLCGGISASQGQALPDFVTVTVNNVTAADGSTANGTMTFTKFSTNNGVTNYTCSVASVTVVVGGVTHTFDANSPYIYVGGFDLTKTYAQDISVPASSPEYLNVEFPQTAFLTANTVQVPYGTDFSNGNNSIHGSKLTGGSLTFSPSGTNNLTISTTSVPNAVSGQAYTFTFTATGGQGAIVWAEVGSNLPAGFNLSSGGTLSSTGSPTVTPGTYQFTVAAMDQAGTSVQKQFSLTVTKPLPKLLLTKATTLDAKSVNISYTISTAQIVQPLTFDVYRSDIPELSFYSQHIGTQTVDPSMDSADLQQGSHTITLIAGTLLPPNQAMPFVVVVANSNGVVSEDATSVNTAYFRKYLLGGVVHGFSFSDTDTLTWMAAMKNDLLNISSFDQVITHEWLGESVTPLPGLTVAAGDDMYSQLLLAAQQLLQIVRHPGDVVDLHLFGHSRGTIVASQVLRDIATGQSKTWQGSYVEVTLLDIHPANTAADNLLDFRSRFLPGGIVSAIAVRLTQQFQDLAQDHEIILPAGAGIMSVDIWYQHTPASQFPLFSSENILDLWGESESANHIANSSGITVQWHDLTSKTYFADGQFFLIGHTEVHEYYRLFEVDNGLVH